jgi:hypothetical protein
MPRQLAADRPVLEEAVPPLEGAVGGLKLLLRRYPSAGRESHRSKERWVG